MLKTFPRGIHPPENKSLTDKLDIEIMPAPKTVYIPMNQHAGKPAVPAVKAGDEVVRGQLIGQAEPNGCNVYSSVCGIVKTVEELMTAAGKAMHVIIENNFKNDNAHLKPLTNPSREDIIKRVADAGICGMGGAGFPTSSKLGVKTPIEELIINACECEPYVTCDHRIMLEYTNKFIGGVLLMQKACGAKKIIIGVENNKADAVIKLNDYIIQNKLENISVVPLKVKYPQGSDKQLIYSLTGKKIAKGQRSSAFGVVVSNVHTAFSLFLAVNEGWQSYSRVMTVTGGGVKNQKNLWVSNGASFEDIINFCGGINEKTPPVKIISGGPMMGKAVYRTDVAATKTTSCLLLLSEDECFTGKPSQCINCGKCARVCPMGLMPMFIDSMAQSGFIEETERYGIQYCIECGCCAYICPAKRTLTQSIVLAKKKLKEAAKK